MSPKVYWQLGGVLCCCFYTSLCSANASNFLKSYQNNNWFIGASAGSAWSKVANNSTSVPNGSSQPEPYNQDLYAINQPGAAAVWSLSGGYRWTRPIALFPRYSLGFRYQHFNSSKINGNIEQYSLPAFTNYNYHVNLYANTFILLGKLNLYQYHSFSPYVSAGLGQARNTVRSYNEQAYSGIIPRVSPAYHSTTNNNFTFNLGLGIDYTVNEKISLALGYEYANLGKTNSGPASGADWYGEKLSFSTLTANIVSLSMYYQIPG
jgi:opacity protein-like surface antigen